MPRVSEFFGIVIALYYNGHAPPHFHAKYGGSEAEIAIETLETIDGSLPRRVFALVLEWAVLHREELRGNLNAARCGEPLSRIAPLE
jgi:hypothetical protein